MPHVAFVPLVGFRICSAELRELGLTLPGLRRRGAALAELPALGLLTLAGMLPEHWTCSYHPADGALDELVEQIAEQKPTIVAISALTASIEQAQRFSGELRRRNIQTVVGGLHATSCADEVMEHFDAVAIGDGESSWFAVLRDAEAGNLQRRYRASKQAARFDWPIPRFDLLGNRVARYTLQTERGCPLSCDFCAASRLLGPFREKPADEIAKELSAISRLDRRPVIELADDNTFAGRRDSAELCNLLAGCDARWFTECDWRIGERPELLEQMAAAGCVQVLVGIESLVFRYPGMGAKRAELSRMMDSISRIQDAGIAVNGCVILGAEGETPASIERLIEFVLESSLADVQLTLQTPFPGTELRKRLNREGRLLPNRGWSHYSLLDVTFRPDCMTVVELERMFRRAIAQVYSATASERRDAIRRATWQHNPSFCRNRLFKPACP